MKCGKCEGHLWKFSRKGYETVVQYIISKFALKKRNSKNIICVKIVTDNLCPYKHEGMPVLVGCWVS